MQHAKPKPIHFLYPYLLSVALWSLFALIIAGYYTAAQAPISVRFGFGVFFGQMVVVLLPFALLTPLVFKLCQGLYRRSRSRLDWLIKNLALCLFWYLLANALSAPFELYFWYEDGSSLWRVVLHRNLNQVLTTVASFWMVATAAVLAGSFKERQQRETAIARVQAQLSEAKLQNLRYQLNPHFLFNSINAAVSFVRTEQNQKAEHMLLALAELMDAYLSPQTPLTMKLEEELELLGKYLEIETIRFGEKLRLEMVVDPASSAVPVPSMLLQPLLENAIRHGIARLTGAGTIRLETRVNDSFLMVNLFNDVNDEEGSGVGHKDGHGLGLSLTRRRLNEAYGNGATMEAGPGERGGFRVHLKLPVRMGETWPRI